MIESHVLSQQISPPIVPIAICTTGKLPKAPLPFTTWVRCVLGGWGDKILLLDSTRSPQQLWAEAFGAGNLRWIDMFMIVIDEVLFDQDGVTETDALL